MNAIVKNGQVREITEEELFFSLASVLDGVKESFEISQSDVSQLQGTFLIKNNCATALTEQEFSDISCFLYFYNFNKEDWKEGFRQLAAENISKYEMCV